MWANVSHWTLQAERIEDERLVEDALIDASEMVARQPGFVQFRAIRPSPDRLVVVTLWESADAARRAATLTPMVKDFYANYVASAELISGEVILTREAEPPQA
jgi:hypothetical protein